MKITKKAMTASFLVGIIITLVAFVLISGVLYRFVSSADDKSAENLCHDSIAFRASSTVNVADLAKVQLSPVLCKTIDKKIKTKEREEVKQEMAEMMARCWWMFNEGRYDHLNANTLKNLFGWSSGGNSCFLCYSSILDVDEIEGGAIPPEEMFKYLRETKYPKVKDKTYLEYIQSYGGPGAVSILDTIYPRNSYGITFLAKSSDDASFGVVDYVATGIFGVGLGVCIIAEPCGLAALTAAGLSGGYVVSHSADILTAKLNFYNEERRVSMIVLDDLKGVQAGKCLVEDLAGQ